MPRPPADQLSQDPKHIRKRIRRRAEPLAEDVEMLASAVKPIEEWDLEELARGRPRSAAGDFRGRPPVWITPAIRTEAARRLKVEAMAYLSGHIADAIKVLAGLMMDETQEPRIRADAAKFIIEHVVGKATAAVQLDLGGGVRELLAGAVVTRDSEGRLVDAHPVVDLMDDEWSDDDDQPADG